ncbi:hypothetical protein P872_02710 [Rhodonellum psychrophilum GCM71 = DSM 17998]|uniref:Uncharacterized protein n=1 Tax=Rhodonellum psychrophilum GCM71 = DSM 17998 TaxID=1123057 RepID=U5BT17_9BACT|nr:hypothetical protein P872_02710 [Rhodonellum psychrophilum GCM71 = DSM 17998]
MFLKRISEIPQIHFVLARIAFLEDVYGKNIYFWRRF